MIYPPIHSSQTTWSLLIVILRVINYGITLIIEYKTNNQKEWEIMIFYRY